MKKKTKTYARFKTRMYDDGGAIESNQAVSLTSAT